MDKKAMLKKTLSHYAKFSTQSASFHGCYEPSIPKSLLKMVGLIAGGSKQAKNK